MDECIETFVPAYRLSGLFANTSGDAIATQITQSIDVFIYITI